MAATSTAAVTFAMGITSTAIQTLQVLDTWLQADRGLYNNK